MKRFLTTAILLVSAFLAPQSRATSRVSASLALPHNNVLPGVPFDLVVTYTNVSDKPITIRGAQATLVVTFENNETVVMHQPDLNDRWTIEGSMVVRLAPGESVQHAASWEGGSIPNWFHAHGSSFSGPGTYDIALDLRIGDEHKQLLGTVRTPAVTLTRVDPVGIDAELWKRMQEISGGKWTDGSFAGTKEGDALAKEIIQLHPGSGYYPYVLALRAFGRGVWDKKHLPMLLEAAQRFMNSPAYPYVLSAAANCARYLGTEAQREGDMGEAKTNFTLAETKYREALATKSVAIRKSSELGLQHVADGLRRTTKPIR